MFSEEVYKIVRECVARHATPEDAAKAAEQRIRALGEFQQLIAAMVTTTVNELVYRERHAVNKALKGSRGEYGQPAKVVVGASTAVNELYQSYYNYSIGASRLGMLMGKELLPLAEIERIQADGHVFNAELLEALHELVPADRQVMQAVNHRKLKVLFETIKRKREQAGYR